MNTDKNKTKIKKGRADCKDSLLDHIMNYFSEYISIMRTFCGGLAPLDTIAYYTFLYTLYMLPLFFLAYSVLWLSGPRQFRNTYLCRLMGKLSKYIVWAPPAILLVELMRGYGERFEQLHTPACWVILVWWYGIVIGALICPDWCERLFGESDSQPAAKASQDEPKKESANATVHKLAKEEVRPAAVYDESASEPIADSEADMTLSDEDLELFPELA